VNIHKNAKLTPASRAHLVERVLEEGEKVSSVAEGMGISPPTVYKWIKRFMREGESGLVDRSSRPQRMPRKTPKKVVRRIVRLRFRRWPSTRIARQLGMAISTVGVVLRRLGLNRLSRLEPRRPTVRYEMKRPGQLVHLDTKKLVRFDEVGHRIHGDRSRQSRGAGWEILHVCIDDATRLVYQEMLPDERGATAVGFLERAAAWFRGHGVPFERVMTDNGSCYVSKRFRRAVKALGAKHVRTRPYRPQTNGKAERYIQTALREWAYAHAYPHSRARAAALKPFTQYYNTERPHWGIKGRSPLEKLEEIREQPV
jgi:transposase InsO family protein